MIVWITGAVTAVFCLGWITGALSVLSSQSLTETLARRAHAFWRKN